MFLLATEHFISVYVFTICFCCIVDVMILSTATAVQSFGVIDYISRTFERRAEVGVLWRVLRRASLGFTYFFESRTPVIPEARSCAIGL